MFHAIRNALFRSSDVAPNTAPSSAETATIRTIERDIPCGLPVEKGPHVEASSYEAFLGKLTHEKFAEFLVTNPVEGNLFDRNITYYSENFHQQVRDEIRRLDILSLDRTLNSEDITIQGEKSLKRLQKYELDLLADRWMISELKSFNEYSHQIVTLVLKIGRCVLNRSFTPLSQEVLSKEVNSLVRFNNKNARDEYNAQCKEVDEMMSRSDRLRYLENRIKRMDSSRLLSSLTTHHANPGKIIIPEEDRAIWDRASFLGCTHFLQEIGVTGAAIIGTAAVIKAAYLWSRSRGSK